MRRIFYEDTDFPYDFLAIVYKTNSSKSLIFMSRYSTRNSRRQSRNISKQYFTNIKVGLRSSTSAFPVHGLASLILMT